ncbi:hypothetical protein DYB30_003977 [Aphanomyces astaci]|uniref:AB hydrolase-1 domain-containing protein n=2 Tax=Aphanomyces astaci TaxID=112090 RepID=A0A397DJU3_APHAT|nr:hypothetical protein DYB30_003977 [Aphanomyces astaci]
MVYCASETIFTLNYLCTKQRLAKPREDPPQLLAELASRRHAPVSVLEFFESMLRHTPDVKTFVEEWFYNTPFECLTRPDLRVLLAYIFYSKEWTELPSLDRRDVNQMVDRLYDLTNVREPPSQTSSKPTHCIRHTLDPFESTARPWLLYAVTIGMDAIMGVFLRLAGFQRHPLTRGLRYWHRDAMTSPVAEPLVFVHGIGAGLMLYLPLLWSLVTTHQNRPILLVETPYVSMQLVEDVPSKKDTLVGLQAMLANHDIQRAHWMGHSLGTAICSWVCQELPHTVSHATFIDPIVFFLWKRDVAYNFLYRPPTTGIQVLLWYFASTEVHIVHVMRRHFWWYSIVCFPEHLPRHPVTNHVAASVFLSSHDVIINALDVHEHLSTRDQGSSKMEVVWWDGFTHGEMLLHSHALTSVTSNVKCRDVTNPIKHVAKWNWADYIVNRLDLSIAYHNR